VELPLLLVADLIMTRRWEPISNDEVILHFVALPYEGLRQAYLEVLLIMRETSALPGTKTTHMIPWASLQPLLNSEWDRSFIINPLHQGYMSKPWDHLGQRSKRWWSTGIMIKNSQPILRLALLTTGGNHFDWSTKNQITDNKMHESRGFLMTWFIKDRGG
jgi:hypothetical protein